MRPRPKRYLAPIGDGDIDRWVNEGLSAYGSLRRTLVAGAGAGAALPWLMALLAFIYAWVNNWFAPSSMRLSFGPGRMIELLLQYGAGLVFSSVLFAIIGFFFALARHKLLHLRQQALDWRFPIVAYALDSRLVAATMGWTLYYVWAIWPRGIDGNMNFSGALQHPWLWVFFGILFSMYLHWAHITLLYRIYYRDWEAGSQAVARRLLVGNLGVTTPCRVEADVSTGTLHLTGFPRGEGADRLKDLLRRVPGVERLQIEEVGDPRDPVREIFTLHVPSEGTTLPLITLGRMVFVVGALTGVLVYLFGFIYLGATGQFFLLANHVIVLAIVVELVGLATGYILRMLICRRAQQELPVQLQRTLHFAGKELRRFAFGSTWQEEHLAADVTRLEARELLVPVAARFGVKRLFVEAPYEARTVESPIRRYGWRGA